MSTGKRTFAIGDIHGRFDLLQDALALIERKSPTGTVVFTGDYVDRGPQSKEVLDRLMAGPPEPSRWAWVCLKGNHEDMMVGAIRGNYEPAWWIGNGGDATLTSFGETLLGEKYVQWAEKLPLIHRDKHRIYVHAGVDETLPLSQQTEHDLLWSRLPKFGDCRHPEGYVVHGHTPFNDGPIILLGRANIDTGAVFSGRMVVAEFADEVPGPPTALHEIIRKVP